ncbi:MAG: carbohydrate-binding protein [Paludibacter sp.]|nr:carbohydrate-binding protein [Paludibacter sp.]
MKKILSISILLLLISFSAIAGNIVYPWRATTAIVKSGQTFEVWFNASSGQSVNSIQLIGAYNTVNVTMSTVTGNWTYDPLSGNTYNRKITVTVPTSAPADRYDLVLNTSSGAETSFGGVKVIKDYKADYYIMHWSDGHLYQSGYDTDVLLKRKNAMIDIANIIDAEIIIETGDNMYNVRNNPEREGYYFVGNSTLGTKGMAKANAATFLVPGDHEGLNGNDFAQGTVQENSDFFNDYWGMQNHNFKYGNGRFMNLNNAWGVSATSNGVHQYEVDDAIAWLNGAGAGGNFLVTAGHSYDRMHKFINSSKPLDLVLAGDKHHSGSTNPWEITPGGPAIAYIVNSIRDHFEFNIFKVNNTAGTFTKPAGTTAMVSVINSGNQDTPSTWVPNLKLTYASANNGSVTSNTATIDNKFAFAITGAKVRFVVPKGNSYAVTGGTITQEFSGTNYYIVDVSTNLTANTPKTVSIGIATIAVTGVTVSPTSASISVGNTQQLTATVAPTNATNKTVTWSTSNASVATVNSSGLVSAVAGGTATITVTTQDGGKTATSAITVATSGTSNGMQILQAEDATYSGPVVATNQTGYYGTGFIDFTNNTGDYVQWTVNVPTAGTYDLSFRYSLLSGSRPLELKVNGTAKIASLDFPLTGSWSTWEKVITSQSLIAGNNTIRLTTIGSNGGNFDELVVAPYVDDCDSATGWSSAGTNTLSYYTTDKKQGAGCVQMVGSGTDEYKKVFSPAYNSNVTLANGALSFWYYVSDVTKCGTVRVELSSGGAADVDELSWALSGLLNGWNKITLNLSSASQLGTPNLNALNWFRIYNTKTASITTRIDAIQLIETVVINRAPSVISSVIDLKSNQNKSVNIYPNPFKQGKLSVDIIGFEELNNVQVKITNLMGQTIYHELLTNKSRMELNLKGKLNDSVYFISVESGDTKVVKKLVVN